MRQVQAKVTQQIIENLLANLPAMPDKSVSGDVADDYMRIGLSSDAPPELKREIGRVVDLRPK